MMVIGGEPRAQSLLAAAGLVGLCALACGGVSQRGAEGEATGGSGETGGSASVSSGTAPSAGTAAGGGAGLVEDIEGSRIKLRVLTQSEYRNALTALLGTVNAPLELPTDLSVAGFVSVGASLRAVSAPDVALYETASRAAAAEALADPARRRELVGCEPEADLGDSCVESFVQRFGRQAFRRELSDGEIAQWAYVGREAAMLAGSSAEEGLVSIVSGLLQSVYFLYRVEVSSGDPASGRLKYDGASMATRLAFLLTGRPPSEELLAAAAAGQLTTDEGVVTAAAKLLDDSSAVPTMASFFSELSQAALVSVVEKTPVLYPGFDARMKSSMLRATQLFLEDVVLAPGADVRALYDSPLTFVDATLAPLYGVPSPASGFIRLDLGPRSSRAGILGQAAVLASHAGVDHTSPSRRGAFISGNFLCAPPPPPPDGVVTIPPVPEPNLTTRQRMEQMVAGSACETCHAQFDQLGFALEHFDPIGAYRETEDGLTIDATGTLDGVAFDGQAELGAVLRRNPRAIACLVQSFHRAANGRASAESDAAQVDALGRALEDRGYVWRDFVAEFIAGDAFRSEPLSDP
jgi:Protein of unknown function (DUF1588)/Protein of unknown function (DUF1592)/Protein of unknown function (DUF1595)/Protein of unknown function (DUF1585)/Protein of unknown function (DUF1587)